MTLFAVSTHRPLPPMPAKSVKTGPYLAQAEGFAQRRRKLKLSQAAVAEAYGGQQGYISDIERGWVNFAGADAEWYERMGRALNIAPQELMQLLGVKFVIASSPETASSNTRLPETSLSSYASLVIPVQDSGREDGTLRDMTVFIDQEIAKAPSLKGLFLKNAPISVAALGMLAIYEPGAQISVDDVVVIEHQGERHVAYALPSGMVSTDTPINPRTPAEFKPDAILGVVRRLQSPEQPRRPQSLS